MSTTTAREAEIARAWRAHRGDPVPAAVRRRLRAFKREMAEPAELVHRRLSDPDGIIDLLRGVTRKRGIGRERALVKSRRLLPGAVIAPLHQEAIEITWLTPSEHIITNPRDPGQTQAGILVDTVIVWRSSARTTEVFRVLVAEFPDHSLGRLLQRNSAADLRRDLLDAVAAFLAAEAEAMVGALATREPIYAPTVGGAFAGQVLGIKGNDDDVLSLLLRPRTWISSAMLLPHQKPLAPAAAGAGTVLDALLALGREQTE
jgi:hypothetical protein